MKLSRAFTTKRRPNKRNKTSSTVFLKNQIPEEMDVFEFTVGIKIANLLKDANLVNSTSDAFRMIKQGAAKIDGEKITDRDLKPDRGVAVYQVGKRKFARITLL